MCPSVNPKLMRDEFVIIVNLINKFRMKLLHVTWSGDRNQYILYN